MWWNHGTAQENWQAVFGQIGRLQNLQGLAIKFTEISARRSTRLPVRWAQSEAEWRKNVSLALRTTGFVNPLGIPNIECRWQSPIVTQCDRNTEAQCIAIPRFLWSIKSQFMRIHWGWGSEKQKELCSVRRKWRQLYLCIFIEKGKRLFRAFW